MPLSEHEERELREIARRLSEDDPKFVATVTNTTPTRIHLRRLRWAVVGFVVGVLLLLGLTFNLAFGVVGFAVMLGSVFFGLTALRSLTTGTSGLADELRRAFDRRSRRSS